MRSDTSTHPHAGCVTIAASGIPCLPPPPHSPALPPPCCPLPCCCYPHSILCTVAGWYRYNTIPSYCVYTAGDAPIVEEGVGDTGVLEYISPRVLSTGTCVVVFGVCVMEVRVCCCTTTYSTQMHHHTIPSTYTLHHPHTTGWWCSKPSTRSTPPRHLSPPHTIGAAGCCNCHCPACLLCRQDSPACSPTYGCCS